MNPIGQMGLMTKFNLGLLLAGALGLGLTAYFSHDLLQRHAREEVLAQAAMMMAAASAIRRYTADEVAPLLAMQMEEEFLPQSVPAYAATRNIQGMRERLPDYTYKEAALNPTNPVDRATEWEVDIIEWFRNHPDEQVLSGKRMALHGDALYLARPIRITDPACLACHGSPAQAPPTLLARYGGHNGFGWQLGETVAAQVVSVPMSVPLARAEQAFKALMTGLVGIFALVTLVINLMLYFIVIRPVDRMAQLAERVSKGEDDATPFAVVGGDQIASLARSFNRMRVSLGSAMQLLERTMVGLPGSGSGSGAGSGAGQGTGSGAGG